MVETLDMDMKEGYTEKQRWCQFWFFWPFFVIAILVALDSFSSALASGGFGLWTLALAATLVVIAIAVLGFRSSLTIEVAGGRIQIQGFGIGTRSFGESQIENIVGRDLPLILWLQRFWGPLALPLFSSWNVSGNHVVSLALRDQTNVEFGSRDPQRLMRAFSVEPAERE